MLEGSICMYIQEYRSVEWEKRLVAAVDGWVHVGGAGRFDYVGLSTIALSYH